MGGYNLLMMMTENTKTANFLAAGDKVSNRHLGRKRTVLVAKFIESRGKMAVKFDDTKPGKVEMYALDTLFYYN